MRIFRDLQGYRTSRDYGVLWELAQMQSVACIVDCENCRDIAQTIFSEPSFINVSARGIGYITAWNKDDFIKQCEESNLEWIVPGKEE